MQDPANELDATNLGIRSSNLRAQLAPYALLQSFFSIAAGVVFQDESLTAALVADAVICVAGVALSQLSLPQFFFRKVRPK